MKRLQSVTLGLLLVVLVGALFFGVAKEVQSWETWCPNECVGCSNLGCYGTPYENGHCTCYAYRRAVGVGWPSGWIDGLGEAYEWDDRAKVANPPLPVGSYPYPNSIAVDNDKGHVAFVTGRWYVGSNTVQFRMDEMNPCEQRWDGAWPCTYCVRQGVVQNRNSARYSFIYPPADKAVLVFPILESIRPEDNPFNLVWYSYNGGPYELEVRLFTIPYA